MTDDFIKWLAGFTDGEGCIGVRECEGRYIPYFVVSNTNKDVIDYIKAVTGVGHVRSKQISEQRKPCYDWYVSSWQDVAELCSKLKPYLRVKRLQAETVLECFFNRSDGDIYVDRIRVLNKRGVQ